MSAAIGSANSRTTLMQSGNQLLSTLRKTQMELQRIQQQISTGRKLSKPSDAPSRTSAVLLLESQIEARQQHERNLDHALSLLNTTDAALADASEILLETKSITSSQVGIGSDAETRANQAVVIEAQIRALLDIANRQFQRVSLFGGNASARRNEPMFVEELGGIRYLGPRDDLFGDVGDGGPLAINTNGQLAFGALSSRVVSRIDLDPGATGDTFIHDVSGAQGVAVRLGTVGVAVNGTTASVDLQGAETLGDVVRRLQHAIDQIDPAAATVELIHTGFRLTAGAGHDVTISDIGSAQTAADLGIDLTSINGAAADGADIDPRLTTRSQLAALGAGVDLINGLNITQGATSKVADFSQAQTIEDMINVVDQLNLGMRLQINADESGFNLVSEISGLTMSIGENMGTTAEDLGLLTFGLQTRLADMRFGLGVEVQVGDDDFAIELHDGRSFSVNVDGIARVDELIAAIEAAATDAGVAVGTDFTVSLRPQGNGLLFEDGTAGAEDFRVVQLGISLAATHLGIYRDVGAGNELVGDDVSMVRAEGVFTDLINLRDSLVNDDALGITLAGGSLDNDLERVALARADIGTRGKRVEQQQERSQELKISEISMLSDLQDTDLIEAITRLTQLQQQLQASLSVGSGNLQTSLLDFLR